MSIFSQAVDKSNDNTHHNKPIVAKIAGFNFRILNKIRKLSLTRFPSLTKNQTNNATAIKIQTNYSLQNRESNLHADLTNTLSTVQFKFLNELSKPTNSQTPSKINKRHDKVIPNNAISQEHKKNMAQYLAQCILAMKVSSEKYAQQAHNSWRVAHCHKAIEHLETLKNLSVAAPITKPAETNKLA